MSFTKILLESRKTAKGNENYYRDFPNIFLLCFYINSLDQKCSSPNHGKTMVNSWAPELIVVHS